MKKPVYCSLAQLTPFRSLRGNKGQTLGESFSPLSLTCELLQLNNYNKGQTLGGCFSFSLSLTCELLQLNNYNKGQTLGGCFSFSLSDIRTVAIEQL